MNTNTKISQTKLPNKLTLLVRFGISQNSLSQRQFRPFDSVSIKND